MTVVTMLVVLLLLLLLPLVLLKDRVPHRMYQWLAPRKLHMPTIPSNHRGQGLQNRQVAVFL